MFKSRLIEQSITGKRHFNKIRSRLKKKIENGALLDQKLINTYRLKNFSKNYRQKHLGHSESKSLISVTETKTIMIPDRFCLIENHDRVLNFIKKLKKELKVNKPFNLTFLHTNSISIGLAASYLFDQVIKNYKKKWISKGYAITLRGYFSKVNKEINNFLLAFGLPKTLEIDDGNYDESLVDPDYKSKFLTMKYEGSNKNDFESGNASTELAEYFNKCLNFSDLQIEENQKNTLASKIGEIIGNAEEHAGSDLVNWVVLGAYNKTTKICSFSIINFGLSIYQSLIDPTSTARKVLEEIEEMIHAQRNIIEKTKQKFKKIEEEPLWNVMAIQDGISSKRTFDSEGKSSTRGQGLMDVLQFVKEFWTADHISQVSIISGKSKIIIDFSYPIKYVNIPGKNEVRRKLLFNNEFSLNNRQDPSKVILMKDFFPGTIITGKFIISEKYLQEKVKNGK